MKIFGWEWKVLLMKTVQSVSKFFIFHFKSVYFGQKLSQNFVFRTTYVRKYDMNEPLKPGFLQRIALCLTKMSDNNNNKVHFSGVRFI